MKYYTIEILVEIYRNEYPELADDVILKKAKELHRELNTLDKYWKRNNRRFYRKIELVGEGGEWYREQQLEQYKT